MKFKLPAKPCNHTVKILYKVKMIQNTVQSYNL